MSWYLTRTATRIRRQVVGQDNYGNDLYEEVVETIQGCSWDMQTSGEAVDARQQVELAAVLYVEDPDVDIAPVDAVEVDGIRFEVDGEIRRWKASRMGNDYAAVPLKRITG